MMRDVGRYAKLSGDEGRREFLPELFHRIPARRNLVLRWHEINPIVRGTLMGDNIETTMEMIKDQELMWWLECPKWKRCQVGAAVVPL
jgi:hypothetical protein